MLLAPLATHSLAALRELFLVLGCCGEDRVPELRVQAIRPVWQKRR